MPLLCLACSSTISLTGESLPSHHEKPDPPAQSLACGTHWICGRCIRQNARLARGCLLCEDVLGSASSGSKSAAANKASSLGPGEKGELPGYEALGDGFVIGDDDDDDDDEAQESRQNKEEAEYIDAPPDYDAELDGTTTTPPTPAAADPIDEKRQAEQPNLHYILPEETLLGLSMKYRVPVRPQLRHHLDLQSLDAMLIYAPEQGRILCTLNKLPVSTLSTTPHLLHTLPFLLLPPSSASFSATPIHSPEEERRRLVLRRFQVIARCHDWAMGKAYVDAVFEKRDKERDLIEANKIARGERGLVEIRQGGELEEALESFMEDSKWENGEIGKGKGKRREMIGSRIRSTGRVEKDAKGWGSRT